MATTPYADETYANTYFGERLNVAAWTAASADNRGRALKEGTRLIDTLSYVGYKTDEDQARQFPRNGEVDVPDEVKQACCEVAIALLQGKTLDSESDLARLASKSVGDASESYFVGGASTITQALGLPSLMAARLLAPWVDDGNEIRIDRV